MNPLIACMVVGLAGFALAEAPVSSGYSYSRPSGGGGGGGGYSFGGGGGGGGFGGGGGGYTQVSTGYQTNEGASVDSALLEQIRQILLKEELQSQQSGGFGGGGGGYAPSSSYGAPSSQYGAPSPQYGVPSYQTRVVGIDLEGIRQAIQVAQFNQVSQGPGGYPSGPSSSYGAPSTGYGAPSRPSSSYGAPF
ncbi:PREDICTED: pro-resilin [Vollenhovia emeryi]|uniref:pro-resilin n=1 Tax=Vollenhovia emeryi TaxID=411798 RepID=UPI0005F566B4|nr:PREDICTED: pro-resilin [Vollenhovia emeryi]